MLYKIGADPVSADQPCGENARYETEFEHLEAELGKQESLNAETVDWKIVGDLSASILKHSSKDLLVGTYLCNALLLNEGYTGLAVGLNILNDMVEQHWEGLFPPLKRMHARSTAFGWLAEKTGMQIQSHPPAAADSTAVVEAADKLKQLDGVLVEKMGDQAPLLTDLSTPLKGYRQNAEAEMSKSAEANTANEASPAPVQAQPMAETAGPQPVPAAAMVEVGALESEADSKKFLRQIQASLRDVASFWMAQKLSDVRAYRLGRLAAWMLIETAPPDNNGVTQISPPAPERLKFFEVQQEKGEFAELIPELEKTLARSPFWLDGHFEVVKSLRALGAEYEAAATTVIRELGSFLQRMPEVLNLSFSDEAAFAGDQTRMWLDAEVLQQQGETTASTATDRPAGESWSLALEEAKKLAASGDSDKGLAMINEGLAGSGQLRDQVYWRCALAELLLQTGKPEAATAILEAVSQQAESRQMSDWEPQLLSRIYNLLFHCYQKQQKTRKDDKSIKEKTEQAFKQLCWFDPLTALSIKGG